MGPVLSQALEQILGLAVSHLPRSLEVAQLQPACLDEMLKDIVHGDWMSRLLSKPACDLVQLFVNVLADPYCSHCRQRHNVTSAIKGVLSWPLPFKNWGKSHHVFLSAQSLCHNMGRSWCHEGPWSDSEDTIENLDFRRVSRRELPAIPPPSNYLSGEGVFGRLSRIVRGMSPFFV